MSRLLVGLVVLGVILLVLSPVFWRWLYPFPYREAVFVHAKRAGLDPYLVAAVAKVESGFQPRAESPRGARGLMQLMPQTAGWVAGQLGVAYDPDFLFDPNYNLRLGTWYLAYLHKSYDYDLILALAAYNGGSGHVQEWLSERKWSGKEANLDQIPFRETRQFVQRVLRNYRSYRRLYGNQKEATEKILRSGTDGRPRNHHAAAG